MIAIFIMSSRDTPEFMRHKLFDFQDKAAHTLAYFILAISLLRALLWHTTPSRLQTEFANTTNGTDKVSGPFNSRKIIFLAIGLAALYGASDEWHQSFVPTRTGSIDDWLADTFGAFLLLFSQRWVVALLEWEKNLWRMMTGFRSP